MANTIITNSDIARHILAHFINACQYVNLANRDYQPEFHAVNGFQRGSNIRILRPTYIAVREGSNFNPTSLQERETFLNLAYQDGTDIGFTSQELTLSLTDYDERVMKPAAIKLANFVDRRISKAVDRACYNIFGGSGTTLNSFANFTLMRKELAKRGVEGPYKAILNMDDANTLGNALQNNFNTTLNEEISIKGRLGLLSDVDIYESANVELHQNGVAAGTPLVAGANQTGSTLVTNGWTPGTTVNQGDVFYFSTGTPVYFVNPVGLNQNGASSDSYQRFVITQSGTADGGGNLTLNIDPPIQLTGVYQTVTNSPSDGAALTYVGTVNTSINKNFMFSREAISLAVVPLIEGPGMVNVGRYTDKKSGLSMRVIDYYDIQTDTNYKRADILYGFQIFPQYLAGLATTS